MNSFNCKGCDRLTAQHSEKCPQCGERMFCNLCGYDDRYVQQRVIIRDRHQREEHLAIDIA